MAGELFAHRRVAREVEGALAAFVPEIAAGAAHHQHLDRDCIAALGGNHQGGTAAIVRCIDDGTALDQEIDNGNRCRRIDAILVAGRPHQRGQVVTIVGLGVDSDIQQSTHDQRKTATGCVDDGRLAGCVHMIRIGAAGEQQFDDAIVTLKGGGGERGHVTASRQIGIAAVGKQRRYRGGPLSLGCRIKRGRAIKIACVDCGALGDKPLDQRHMSAPCRKSKRHRTRPVARLQRCAGRSQATRQSTAVPGRRSKQHGVELNRREASPGEIVVLLKLTAISLGGAGMTNRQGTKKRYTRSQHA